MRARRFRLLMKGILYAAEIQPPSALRRGAGQFPVRRQRGKRRSGRNSTEGRGPGHVDAAKVRSFSGAFLAARTADVDHDYDTAITLYRKALTFDPANLEIRERLMISLFLKGDFDGGVKEATNLKDDKSVDRITRIVRGLNDIRDGRYETRAGCSIIPARTISTG